MEGFNINMSDVYKTIFAIQVYEEKPSELKFYRATIPKKLTLRINRLISQLKSENYKWKKA